MRRCTRCGVEKSEDLFYRTHWARSDGFDSWCKECRKAKATEWNAANKERRNARARGEGYHKRRPNHAKSRRKSLYGISTDEYDRMCEEQKGLCAICFKTPTVLCVDHNHTTNKVRGLLCGNCNRGIGMLQDSFDVASAASEYLKKHSHQP